MTQCCTCFLFAQKEGNAVCAMLGLDPRQGVLIKQTMREKNLLWRSNISEKKKKGKKPSIGKRKSLFGTKK